MRRRFGRRTSAARPTRTWLDASPGFGVALATSTTASIVMQMQAPASPTNLTADPPEDITILRMRGTFSVVVATPTLGSSWTCCLIVQDTTWTPSATFGADSDKRMLWTRTFGTPQAAVSYAWNPPGIYTENLGTGFPGDMATTELDIAPKVRLEPGKALYFVAYETGAGGTLTVLSADMRLLFQRSRRR